MVRRQSCPKPALLKEKLVLLCLRLWNLYTIMFSFNIPQRSEVYNHRIFIIHGYTLLFTLCCSLCARGAKYRKRMGLRTQTLLCRRQRRNPPNCQWGHPDNPLFSIFGVIILLNEDDGICIAVQHRLPELTHSGNRIVLAELRLLRKQQLPL